VTERLAPPGGHTGTSPDLRCLDEFEVVNLASHRRSANSPETFTTWEGADAARKHREERPEEWTVWRVPAVRLSSYSGS
jgi:hypothetical protein